MKPNCIKSGRPYYRITKTIGQTRKDFYGTTLKEAKEKAETYMASINKGYSLDYDKQIFINVLREWLFAIKRVAVKPSTFVSYEGIYRNYLSSSPFAHAKINAIKKLGIQSYYNNLFENGKTTEKIKMINKLLHSFFEYAVDEGYILKNPCHKISIPKHFNFYEDKKLEVFTEDEINYIAKEINGLKFEYIILTAIYTRNAWRRTTWA